MKAHLPIRLHGTSWQGSLKSGQGNILVARFSAASRSQNITHDSQHTTHDLQHTTHNEQHTTHNLLHTAQSSLHTHNRQHTAHNSPHTTHEFQSTHNWQHTAPHTTGSTQLAAHSARRSRRGPWQRSPTSPRGPRHLRACPPAVALAVAVSAKQSGQVAAGNIAKV